MIDCFWLLGAPCWDGFQDEAGTRGGENDVINY